MKTLSQYIERLQERKTKEQKKLDKVLNQL